MHQFKHRCSLAFSSLVVWWYQGCTTWCRAAGKQAHGILRQVVGKVPYRFQLAEFATADDIAHRAYLPLFHVTKILYGYWLGIWAGLSVCVLCRKIACLNSWLAVYIKVSNSVLLLRVRAVCKCVKFASVLLSFFRMTARQICCGLLSCCSWTRASGAESSASAFTWNS